MNRPLNVLLKPITSDQMYSIEQNGDSIFGMRRFLMMENAGHGVADFVVRKFKNLKTKTIVAVWRHGKQRGRWLRGITSYGRVWS